MIDFIRDWDIPSEILNLIEDSEEYVVIVSPYISIWDNLTFSLNKSIKRKVVIKWYYREGEVKPDVINELEKIGVKMKGIDNLHSKLYLSEKLGVVSSMNLYEYSSNSNREIGLVTDKSDLLKDFKYYIEEQLTDESILPKKKSVLDKVLRRFTNDEIEEEKKVKVVEKVETKKSNKPTFKRTQSNGDGHCIRCSTSIPFNTKYPYCGKCFKSWNRYKNKSFTENHCHQCSKDWETTFLKPICMSCFKTG